MRLLGIDYMKLASGVLNTAGGALSSGGGGADPAAAAAAKAKADADAKAAADKASLYQKVAIGAAVLAAVVLWKMNAAKAAPKAVAA